MENYTMYSIIGSAAPIRSTERKILLIPLIFMLVCVASFVCDVYFYIHHNASREMNNGGITVVHFLTVRL